MILLSFGTRPEWIKIKPLLDQMDGNIPYRLLFTGQHVDLLSKVGKDKDLVKLEIKDGPISRKYHVQSVKVTTAGTNHEIPLLLEDDAQRLHDQIVQLIKEGQYDL